MNWHRSWPVGSAPGIGIPCFCCCLGVCLGCEFGVLWEKAWTYGITSVDTANFDMVDRAQVCIEQPMGSLKLDYFSLQLGSMSLAEGFL